MMNSTSIPAADLDQQQAPVADGPRKLVRPRLPDASLRQKNQSRRRPEPLLIHQDPGLSSLAHQGSHAELFYFQKQVQAQTPMVFVLDDGERIEGVIEWCDLHVIKVRHITRTMIYKSSIKYLYKAAEVRAAGVAPA